MKKFLTVLFILFLFPLSVFSKESINIAFTIDNNYPIFTLLAINSILNNNTSNSDYNFYIVEDNLTKKNKQKMEKFIRNRKQNVEFIHFDTKIIDDGNYLYSFTNRITPIAMARIMLPDLLPDNVKRVLYLDGDILVISDLKQLYETDLDNKSTGMALNIVKNNKFKKYYNSGVILMDLEKWRKENISKQMLDFLKANKKDFIYTKSNEEEIFLYPDQDLINIVLNNKIHRLSYKWNNQFLYNSKFPKTGIIHFIGPVKPWSYNIVKNKGIQSYMKMWNSSPLIIYKPYYALKGVKNIYIAQFKIKFERYSMLSSKIHVNK